MVSYSGTVFRSNMNLISVLSKCTRNLIYLLFLRRTAIIPIVTPGRIANFISDLAGLARESPTGRIAQNFRQVLRKLVMSFIPRTGMKCLKHIRNTQHKPDISMMMILFLTR